MNDDLRPADASNIAGAANASKLKNEIDRGDWRRLAERASISLLNKEALEKTVEHWQKKYDETQAQLRRMENLLRMFDQELKAQKQILVKALQVKVSGSLDTE